ncbi:branched-chain amino acid ABC transporter permease [Actinoplanes sp. NPDC051411]|uniref:branched-chain amino acid ABC transporter permease n=1 Tax=Actinoplanes sp. NPDC051411 TaxID=3155522 RepID=UPI00341F4DA7
MTFVLTELVMMTIYIVLAASFDLIIGRGGMFSIAHAAFFAIGAYATAQITDKLGVPVLVGWALGAVLCGMLSLLLALVAVRVSSDYLVIVSFGFLTIVLAVLSNVASIGGGYVGLSGIPAPSAFGYFVGSDAQFVGFYLAVTAVVVALLLYLAHSPFGRTLKAIRDNPLAAEAIGKRPTIAKLWVFSIAGAFAGIAGAMYASYISYISPDAFGSQVNTLIFAMVFVGGAGSVLGSVLGAIALTWIPALISLASLPPDILGNLEQAAYGLLLVIMVMAVPGGIGGAVASLTARLRHRRPPADAGAWEKAGDPARDEVAAS